MGGHGGEEHGSCGAIASGLFYEKIFAFLYSPGGASEKLICFNSVTFAFLRIKRDARGKLIKLSYSQN